MSPVRVVLASASPARLATLRSAGLDPDVVVSGVDESAVRADTAAALVAELARRKAVAVAARTGQVPDHETIIVGCDSVLEFDGQILGKPGTADRAATRWRRMRGHCGVLHTGHHVIVQPASERGAASTALSRSAATTVHFAELSDAEIDAYVATGEPMEVAGAFTVDGLGGAFVSRIEGDHHNVVGISLPLLREMVIELGVEWTDIWSCQNLTSG